LAQVGLLMMFQLIGEAVVASLGIPFPGPLCGMLLLLGYLYLRGGPSEELSSIGSKLVDNLGLLFVPAGTAIVAYGALFATDGLAIVTALVLSTLLAVLIGGAIVAAAEQPALARHDRARQIAASARGGGLATVYDRPLCRQFHAPSPARQSTDCQPNLW
jgi:holin-like protein